MNLQAAVPGTLFFRPQIRNIACLRKCRFPTGHCFYPNGRAKKKYFIAWPFLNAGMDL